MICRRLARNSARGLAVAAGRVLIWVSPPGRLSPGAPDALVASGAQLLGVIIRVYRSMAESWSCSMVGFRAAQALAAQASRSQASRTSRASRAVAQAAAQGARVAAASPTTQAAPAASRASQAALAAQAAPAASRTAAPAPTA